ncbi:SDR family oxidoreductase [Candidatus Poribacteria bacterium]|nr:SDR family oxidoreductase [Candidatus Poribacteria bacterium]
MNKLDGKTALITGSGRGIGRAIVLTLAKAGCNVAIVSRTQNEISQVATEIENSGGKCLPIKADISEPLEVDEMIEETLNTFGQLDIFINNAGIAIFKPFLELTQEDWDKTMGINLRGAFICCQKVAQVMIKQKSGAIITICSSASRKPYPNQMAYVTSKHGLLGLTKCLSLELKPYGIRVHAICPGSVVTKLNVEARPDADISDWMQPEDIANLILMVLTLNDRAIIDEVYIRRYDASPIY